MTVSSVKVPPCLVDAGIMFRDPTLLSLALTHASKDRLVNNQRLEFLGDRVLGLVLAHRLYVDYPGENEGEMALRHAALVRAEMLAQIARTQGLQQYIVVSGHSPSAGGLAVVDNVLADALEALIGAIYLDQGFSVAQSFIQKLWADTLLSMVTPPRDAKTVLQEWAQGRGLPLPVYTLVSQTGPDHQPVFIMTVEIKGFPPATGSAASRRLAEKAAAINLLEHVSK